jgi:hypothetical protein
VSSSMREKGTRRCLALGKHWFFDSRHSVQRRVVDLSDNIRCHFWDTPSRNVKKRRQPALKEELGNMLIGL